MRIDGPFLTNIPETVTEKTDSTTPAPGTAVDSAATTEPVQIQHSLPKTDSVEVKTNSFFNFPDSPKLDAAQVNLQNANAVPASQLPGVPFREKVELPKTLPNGTAVDGGVGSGDLGLGKTRPGPNHMGIDMNGINIKNQLNDALNLGAGAQTTAPSAGTVNYNVVGGKTGAEKEPTYSAGFDRPGMGLISAPKTPQNPLGLDDYVDPRKYNTEPASELGKFIYDNTLGRLTGKKWDDPEGIDPKDPKDPNDYTSPDADGTQNPTITQDMLERAKLRAEANQRPSNEDGSQGTIDGAVLSGSDPRRPLISNPLPDDSGSSSGNAGSVDVHLNATGPQTIGNDPVIGGGGEPIVIDPNRPKP